MMAPVLAGWFMHGPHHLVPKDPLSVTLSSTMVAPGQTISISASLSEHVQPSTYVFWIRGPRQGWRRIASASGQVTIKETTPGLYWVRVEAVVSEQRHGKGRGHWPGRHILFSPPALFDVGGGIKLSVRPESVADGGIVVLRAWARGVPGPLYQFSYETPNGQWVTAGAFSHISHVRLKMTEPGTYEGRVMVKTRGGETFESETVDWSVYGSATALTLVPTQSTWVADGAETGAIKVEAVDAQGDLVPTFNGSGTITDTSSGGAISAWGTSPGALVSVSSNPTETLTFHHGMAEVYIQAGTLVASDTLTATAALSSTTTLSGTVTISAVSQVATAIAVSPVSTYLVANESGNPATFDVSVDDQVGEPMLSGTYALEATLTGPAQFSTLTTGPLSVTYLGGEGAVPVTVYSVAGESGTVTLTVSGTNLTSGSASLTAIFGRQPAQASVTAASTTLTDGQSTVLTVGQVSQNGGPVDPASVNNSGYVITITGANNVPASGFTLNGAAYTGSPVTVAIATGANGFYATSQTVTLGATSALPGTYTIQVAFADVLFRASTPLTITVTSPPAPNS
jgi:hypothetical protein